MDIFETIIESSYRYFGITAVKPYQMLVMHKILENKIASGQIVILPTGTGKSLCFLVPALLCKGISIIVYPLLALMNDQNAKLKANNINTVVIRGGQTREQRNKAFEDLESGKAKIVITNPETLMQDKIIKRLKELHISLFVCDEAHVIAKWGPEFRPAYMKLREAVKTLNPDQVLAFTATAGKETIDIICDVLFKNKPVIVKGDSDRENIIYRTYMATDKTLGVINLLKTCKKPALVFCTSRGDTNKLCLECKKALKTIPMRYYNAGLGKNVREALEKWFMESTDGVLFSTCAYGLGVDKSNIRSVIHYSLPTDAEEYLQESGRAGRDGKESEAWVITDSKDRKNKKGLIKIFTENECYRSKLLLQLGQVKNECTGCDVCNNRKPKTGKERNLIYSLVHHYPFRYTSKSGAMVLSGTDRLQKYNPLFAKLSGTDTLLIVKAIEAMCGEELDKIKIKKADRLYPTNSAVCRFAAKLLKIIF